MNKFKKVFMAVPLLVGSLFSATACSSNVKFNQEDLDKVMEETREYLESQNNYSSEFAKNRILAYLTKGIDKLDDSYVNFAISGVFQEKDAFGNIIDETNFEYKIYIDKTTNTSKSYLKNGTQEMYGIMKFSVEDGTPEYELKVYDVATKKYDVYDLNTEEEIVLSKVLMVDVSKYYIYCLPALTSSESKFNIVMDKLDNSTDEFIITKNENASFMKMTFKDGLLVGIEEKTSPVSNNYSLGGDNKSAYSFQYNISDFEIPNLSSYTKR